MNFEDFEQILKKIQSGIPCRDCGAHFEKNHIRIIGTLFNEGFFMALCPQCENRMLINSSLQAMQKRTHRPLHLEETHVRKINPDDILDMRNFLKDFDGDFINLFIEKK